MKFGELTLIFEGGNAVQGVTRINQENVQQTLDNIINDLKKNTPLTEKDVASLGSTGKKNKGGSSGDIDLAVDFTRLISKDVKDIDDVLIYLKNLADKLSANTKLSKGLGEVHLAYPIANVDGKQKDEFVQLDFMPTDNMAFSKFTYYSPAEWESKYKGLHRNILLFAILKFSTLEVLETGEDAEGNEVPAVVRKVLLNMDKGLSKVTQSFKGKKGNITKGSKAIKREFLTNDPELITTMAVGSEYGPKDIMKYDDLIKIVLSSTFIHKKHRNEILKEAGNTFIKLGALFPTELKEYV
jgi:hypothetical protein